MSIKPICSWPCTQFWLGPFNTFNQGNNLAHPTDLMLVNHLFSTPSVKRRVTSNLEYPTEYATTDRQPSFGELEPALDFSWPCVRARLRTFSLISYLWAVPRTDIHQPHAGPGAGHGRSYIGVGCVGLGWVFPWCGCVVHFLSVCDFSLIY